MVLATLLQRSTARLWRKTQALPRPRLAAADTLSIPAFRSFWAGFALTNLANQMRQMIVAWVVLELTDSSLWVGLVNGLPGFASAGLGVGKELCKILADHPDLCRSRGEPELFSDGWRYVIKTQLVVAKAVNMFRFIRRQTRDDLRRNNIAGIDQFL